MSANSTSWCSAWLGNLSIGDMLCEPVSAEQQHFASLEVQGRYFGRRARALRVAVYQPLELRVVVQRIEGAVDLS
jgi:hypothetical protein